MDVAYLRKTSPLSQRKRPLILQPPQTSPNQILPINLYDVHAETDENQIGLTSKKQSNMDFSAITNWTTRAYDDVVSFATSTADSASDIGSDTINYT